jgi:hypothetical protein
MDPHAQNMSLGCKTVVADPPFAPPPSPGPATTKGGLAPGLLLPGAPDSFQPALFSNKDIVNLGIGAVCGSAKEAGTLFSYRIDSHMCSVDSPGFVGWSAPWSIAPGHAGLLRCLAAITSMFSNLPSCMHWPRCCFNIRSRGVWPC